MLTHQSRSLPVTQPVPNARLSRAPSVSSQSHIQTAVKKGHRGSSPAISIRTFTPDGTLSTSPPLPNTFSRSLSPNPLRANQFNIKKNDTPSTSSNADNRNPLLPGLGFRRLSATRSVSPLLLNTPKSPTPSENSSSPGPLSPLLGSIQIELYQKKDTSIFLPMNEQPEFCPEERAKPLGRLHFRLKYDYDTSDLHVHIIEAHDLISSEMGGFKHAQVRAQISPNVDSRKRETKIHQNEPNPFFDEHFKFPASQDQLRDAIIIFQIFDIDRYSKNDIVGEVTMRLDDYNVTTNLEVWAEIYKNKNPSGEKQEILVSLSFLPSAERLTVVILKARNLSLNNHSQKEALDPFAKIYLIGDGKRMKKKKTSYRKGTNDPVWNEAVSFSVTPSSINSCALEFCVLNQSPDIMGSPAFIGSCVIGPRESGSELNHWLDMRNNYKKSITRWHVLRSM